MEHTPRGKTGIRQALLVCLCLLRQINHLSVAWRPFLLQPSRRNAEPAPLFLKHLEVWTLHFSPLPAFENWPLPSLGLSSRVSSDSTKPLAHWGLRPRVGAGFFRSKQNLNALAPDGKRKWKYTPECICVTLGLQGWRCFQPHKGCPR